MAKTEVLVLGGNFGGLTAALELKHELNDDVSVRVVSTSDRFVFNPSLIWLPFGKRDAADITFPLAETFAEHGIDFVHATAIAIDPAAHRVTTTAGTFDYDYLVISTGYRNNFAAVPGLGPDGHAHTITTLADAESTAVAWQEFLADPGPVVVAATQGASCFGAAYEFLFNVHHQLAKAKISVPLTFVTSEPFLGHFGIGGLKGGEAMLEKHLAKSGVTALTGQSIDEITSARFELAGGTAIPFRFGMAIPPFVGQDVVKETPGLSDDKGYVPVHDTYQSKSFPEIYAVGIAAQVPMPWHTAVPIGVPKTGFPTDAMAKIAARNIASTIKGEPQRAHKEFAEMLAVCMLDAGNSGVMILADHILPPRKAGVLIPGPEIHAMKLAFEKYFLWKSRHGYVRLP
ncbi:FAD-dependent oxidoreductase [Antrihabitans sp. YC3-6]|uniref:FAD-dependent oxidoreductase n=1 Tax=Antrihabitans stalagmiti TaxID=2799499 RepID=A0A934NTN3_9NOCA|nr:FAD-dependent oxidoreductase [Antrihabitans stalagmiti]MBJ8341291.1 FAD-dependent oxidoreductase [Antrihabitans stalagmiti]